MDLVTHNGLSNCSYLLCSRRAPPPGCVAQSNWLDVNFLRVVFRLEWLWDVLNRPVFSVGRWRTGRSWAQTEWTGSDASLPRWRPINNEPSAVSSLKWARSVGKAHWACSVHTHARAPLSWEGTREHFPAGHLWGGRKKVADERSCEPVAFAESVNTIF